MPLFKGEGDAVITLEGFGAEDIGAAPKNHGHEINQVTGLQQALDQKQPSGEYQPIGDYAPAVHEHGINEVTGLQQVLDQKQPAGDYQPSGSYAPALHGHEISNVTGLQDALDQKQPVGNYQPAGSYAPALHGHGIGQVVGLQEALDQKQTAGQYQPVGNYAPAVHGHKISDLTGFQEALDQKQPADGDLTEIAKLTTRPFGRSLLEREDAQSLRSLLELPNFSIGAIAPSNPQPYHQWIELDPSEWVRMRWMWDARIRRWVSLELQRIPVSFFNVTAVTSFYVSMGEQFNYDYQLIHFRGRILVSSAQSSNNNWTITLNSAIPNNTQNSNSVIRTNDIPINSWTLRLGHQITPGDQPTINLIQKSTDFPVIVVRASPSNSLAGGLYAALEFTHRWVRP